MEVEKLKAIICPLFNEQVVLTIFKKASGYSKVDLKSIQINDPGTNKGDSYLSSIIKFTIFGTGTSTNDKDTEEIKAAVIVKYIPKNIGRQKTFRSLDFFKNEVAFYNTMYEALMEFQKSKNIKNIFDGLPQCLYALADGKNDFIALDDLSVKSFISIKRQGEMDYNTVLYIIRLFAKFHALSYAYKMQHPKEFKEKLNDMMETYFDEKYRKWYECFHKDIIIVSRDAIAKELPQHYLEKFDDVMKNDFYGKFIERAADDRDPLAVITQGDAWIPNFLVRYNKNDEIIDAKIIDFQLARCSSLACDISFFLYSSSNYNFYNIHWDKIYKEYFSTFKSFVNELGTDTSNLTDDVLKESIKKNSLIGIGMAMECLPFQLMADHDSPDLDTIQGEEAVPLTDIWKVGPIQDKAGRQRIASVFKHAFDNEFL